MSMEAFEFYVIADVTFYCLAFGLGSGIGSGLIGLYRDHLERKHGR